MKPTLLIIALFTFLQEYANAQITKEQIPLRSYGEMPADLQSKYTYSTSELSQVPHIKIGQTKLNERQLIFSNLLNSGLLVYGDDVHALCKEILSQLLKADPISNETIAIYPFKSTFTGMLNDQKNTIYVSTAYVAQCTKVEQLYFGIAHQLYLLKSKAEPSFMKLNRKTSNLDRFSLLCEYPQKTVNEADNYAFKLCGQLNINKSIAIQGIDVLRFAHLPFGEKPIPANYFNSQSFSIPPTYFQFGSYNFKKNELTSKDSVFILRKNPLKSMLSISDSAVTAQKSTLFDQAQLLCRYQLIVDQLIEFEAEKALYSIFLLEEANKDNLLLDQYKAQAWMLIVESLYHPSLLQKKQRPVITDSENGRFFIVLNRLTTNAKSTLALRITTDLMAKYPQDKVFPFVRNQLFNSISDAVLFPIEKFTKNSSTTSSSASSSSTDKYENLENGKAPKDSIDFYLFGIPDIVSDTLLVSYLKNGIPENNTSIKTMSVLNISSNHFQNNKFQQQKSAKKTALVHSIIVEQAQNSGVTLQFATAPTSTDKYNQMAMLSRSIYQSSRQMNNLKPIIPVDINYYLSICTDNKVQTIGSFNYESDYHLRPKGYHFTGLLLVPFPFMASDLVLGGNHTSNINFVFDASTGTFIQHEISRPRIPVTKQFVKAKYYYLFNQLSKSNDNI